MYHDVNRIVLTGRVHEPPEMCFADDGEPYTTFLLGCLPRRKPKHKQRPDLFWLRANGETLAALCKDLLPGTRVLVEGRLQTQTDHTENGIPSHAYEVCVKSIIVLHSPPDALGAAVLLPRTPSPVPSTMTAEREPCSTP